MTTPRPRFLGAALLFLLLTTVGTGQTIAVCNRLLGQLTLLQPDGTLYATFSGLGELGPVASDGVDHLWALRGNPGALYRIDLNTLDISSQLLPAEATSVAMMPDGGALVGLDDGGGALLHFDAEGVLLETWPSPGIPQAILVAPGGESLVAVTGGPNETSLARFDAGGGLLSQHPLGLEPRSIVRAEGSEVLVLCRSSREIWRYQADGSLLDVVSVGPGAYAVAVAPDGDWVVAYAALQQLESRAPDGALAMTATQVGLITSLGFDGAGRLWAQDWQGSVTATQPWQQVQASWSGSHGLEALGDFTGLEFCRGAGRFHDSDADGVRNGDELDAGTDPFDSTDQPFFIAGQPVGGSGNAYALALQAVGFGYGAYRLGVAFTGRPPGDGPAGFALADDGLFRAAQQSYLSWFGAPIGILDPYGLASPVLQLPPLGNLSGVQVRVAMLVWPDLTDPLHVVASPSFACSLP